MWKIVIFLLFALIAQNAVGTDDRSFSNVSSANKCEPCRRPGTDVDNKAPDVTALELDKAEILAPPPAEDPGKKPEPTRDMVVMVKTTANDPEGDVLTYKYTISGGRIVGAGATVSWDVNDARPGTYTITAGVDDGCGICGKAMTQTVTIVEASK